MELLNVKFDIRYNTDKKLKKHSMNISVKKYLEDILPEELVNEIY